LFIFFDYLHIYFSTCFSTFSYLFAVVDFISLDFSYWPTCFYPFFCFFVDISCFIGVFIQFARNVSQPRLHSAFLQRFVFSVRDLCERQSDDADVPVWSPRCVPEVLREDHPDGVVAASVASTLRHLSCQDSTTEAECHDVSVALLCERQVLGRTQLSFQLQHGKK
jgi:hypothetical protein